MLLRCYFEPRSKWQISIIIEQPMDLALNGPASTLPARADTHAASPTATPP
jgi:hypothetical protein